MREHELTARLEAFGKRADEDATRAAQQPPLDPFDIAREARVRSLLDQLESKIRFLAPERRSAAASTLATLRGLLL